MIARVLLLSLPLLVCGAAGADENVWTPGRLPGPQNLTPETCKQYPEVCKARKEEIRRRQQACIDNPASCSEAPRETVPETPSATASPPES